MLQLLDPRSACLGAQRLSASKESAPASFADVNARLTVCSTPFGIQGIRTRGESPGATIQSSAQRLSASKESAHRCLECDECLRRRAQRLSASKESALHPSQPSCGKGVPGGDFQHIAQSAGETDVGLRFAAGGQWSARTQPLVVPHLVPFSAVNHGSATVGPRRNPCCGRRLDMGRREPFATRQRSMSDSRCCAQTNCPLPMVHGPLVIQS